MLKRLRRFWCRQFGHPRFGRWREIRRRGKFYYICPCCGEVRGRVPPGGSVEA